jgi:integrase
VEENIAVMRAAGETPEGVRLRGIIVVLRRAGLRISEALALTETDLDADRGSVTVRRGRGDKRREVGMDRWAWTRLAPWPELPEALPVDRLFCVVRGPTPRTAVGFGWDPRPASRRGYDTRRQTSVRAASGCDTPTRLRCHARGFACW